MGSRANENSECEAVAQVQPLSQGDIFERRGSQEFLVLITAECDIQQDKYGASLTFLRVLTLNELYSKLLYTVHLPECINRCETKIVECLDEPHQRTSVNAIVNKSEAVGIDAVCSLFVDGKQELAKSLLRLLEKLKEKQVDMASKSSSEPDEKTAEDSTVVTAKAIYDSLDFKSAITKQINGSKILSPLNDLPSKMRLILEDRHYSYYYIHELTEYYNSGYVIALREVKHVTRDDLTENYTRIARLRDRFKFAVGAAYGQLFTRIGRPGWSEDRAKSRKEHWSPR